MALRSAGEADPDRVGRLSNDANRRPGADPSSHRAIIARIGLRVSGCCPCQGIATPRTVPLRGTQHEKEHDRGCRTHIGPSDGLPGAPICPSNDRTIQNSSSTGRPLDRLSRTPRRRCEMRYRIYRHLRAVAAADPSAGPSPKRPEMTWKDHLVMLLHIGAEIEHSLMVQYLYAAYSLGGEQVPPRHRNRVRHWQASVLAVAKEEMGHFLTVQNILTLIGAPINLNREDLPWDVPFYPFPFRLEPLSMESVACYG